MMLLQARMLVTMVIIMTLKVITMNKESSMKSLNGHHTRTVQAITLTRITNIYKKNTTVFHISTLMPQGDTIFRKSISTLRLIMSKLLSQKRSMISRDTLKSMILATLLSSHMTNSMISTSKLIVTILNQ